MSQTKKILVAMDFDHTIIDENSDTYLSTICPDGKVPQHIEEKFSTRSWTKYMQAIFSYLHENNVTEEQIKKCMLELPFTEGMRQLLSHLFENADFDVIIISDSNSLFIEYVLKGANMFESIDAVYTNPAQFGNDGCLKIEYYHVQDWCDLSTANLCKGHILEEHIKTKREANIVYDCVLYVGDGTNDLCPALRLNAGDYICPRKDFRLWKKMKKLGLLEREASDAELKADILVWETGHDILELCQKVQRELAV